MNKIQWETQIFYAFYHCIVEKRTVYLLMNELWFEFNNNDVFLCTKDDYIKIVSLRNAYKWGIKLLTEKGKIHAV